MSALPHTETGRASLWRCLDFETQTYRLVIADVDDLGFASFRLEFRKFGNTQSELVERIPLPRGVEDEGTVSAFCRAVMEQLPRSVGLSVRVRDLLPSNFSTIELDPNHRGRFANLLNTRPQTWTDDEYRELARSLIAGVSAHYRLRHNRWGVPAGDRGIELLVQTRAARRIRSLDLRDVQLGRRGAQVLGCGAFRELESLTLSRNQLTPEMVQLIFKKGFPNLGRLDLSYCGMDESTGLTLAELLPLMPRIDTLDLSHNPLSPRSLSSILRVPESRLTDLSLANYTGGLDRELRSVLFGEEKLRGLRRLNLYGVGATEDDLENLNRHQPELVWLEISDNGLPAQCLERLKGGWFPSLDFLGFHNQPVRRTTLRRLRSVRSELQISYSDGQLV